MCIPVATKLAVIHVLSRFDRVSTNKSEKVSVTVNVAWTVVKLLSRVASPTLSQTQSDHVPVCWTGQRRPAAPSPQCNTCCHETHSQISLHRSPDEPPCSRTWTAPTQPLSPDITHHSHFIPSRNGWTFISVSSESQFIVMSKKLQRWSV